MEPLSAQDELDAVLDALLQAVPLAKRDEVRAHLQAAHDPGLVTHAIEPGRTLTPYHDLHEDGDRVPTSDSALAPVPASTSKRNAQIAANLDRTVTRVPTPATLGAVSPVPSEVRPREVLDRPMVRLSEVTPEPLRWLWPGYVPAGKLTILDGDPGLGKSTLLCELASRISCGEPLPGGEPGPLRRVLLCSAEDDLLDTIRPRIDAAGGDPQRIISFLAVPGGKMTISRPLALPGDLLFLEALVLGTEAALVILDPLVAYLRRGGFDTANQNPRHALTGLNETAVRTGAAIIAVRHLTKSKSTNPLYRRHGGIGIIGAARAGLLLTADPNDPDRRVLAVSKGNLSRPAPSLVFRLEDESGGGVARVVWEGESPWTATQLLRAQNAEGGEERISAVDAARTWLREALAAGPRLVSELRRDAAAHGIGEKALYAARKAERMTTFKERVPAGRWFWSLGTTGDGNDVAPTDVQTL